MQFTESYDLLTGEFTYTIKIERRELIHTTFYSFDRALFDDCNTENVTIADRLLALELIARRIEESELKVSPSG